MASSLDLTLVGHFSEPRAEQIWFLTHFAGHPRLISVSPSITLLPTIDQRTLHSRKKVPATVGRRMGGAGSPPCRSLWDLSKCQICVASPFPKGARAHQAVVQPSSDVGELDMYIVCMCAKACAEATPGRRKSNHECPRRQDVLMTPPAATRPRS